MSTAQPLPFHTENNHWHLYVDELLSDGAAHILLRCKKCGAGYRHRTYCHDAKRKPFWTSQLPEPLNQITKDGCPACRGPFLTDAIDMMEAEDADVIPEGRSSAISGWPDRRHCVRCAREIDSIRAMCAVPGGQPWRPVESGLCESCAEDIAPGNRFKGKAA